MKTLKRIISNENTQMCLLVAGTILTFAAIYIGIAIATGSSIHILRSF